MKKFLYTVTHVHKYGETTYTVQTNKERDICSEEFLNIVIEKTGMDYEEAAGESVFIAEFEENNIISLD